jgi:hypothetical protein
MAISQEDLRFFTSEEIETLELTDIKMTEMNLDDLIKLACEKLERFR